jgi:hypothetical protein
MNIFVVTFGLEIDIRVTLKTTVLVSHHSTEDHLYVTLVLDKFNGILRSHSVD